MMLSGEFCPTQWHRHSLGQGKRSSRSDPSDLKEMRDPNKGSINTCAVRSLWSNCTVRVEGMGKE